jgi:large subunit ribosomal protein L3
MGHGSQYHRGVGSLGTRLPMHVLKGKKMPGHMGNETVTIQNLEIVDIDLENNVILVKGNVPGPKKSLVIITTSSKNPDKKNKEIEELIDYTDKKQVAALEEELERIEEASYEEIKEAIEEEQEETNEKSQEAAE